MVDKQQKKHVKKYNKLHLENAVNKNNYHNNTLSYSVSAILEATSTLNPGYHVLAILKSLKLSMPFKLKVCLKSCLNFLSVL
jgi:hypothetical protein